MIFIGGAGAMAEAAKAMRKIQKRIDRRVDLSRRRAKRHGHPNRSYEPERTDFPCVHLCGSCGYFVDDPSPAADTDPACPACGDTGWFDLADESVAGRVRDMEAQQRNTVPTWVNATTIILPVLLLIALGIGMVVAGAPWTVFLALFLLALVVVPMAYLSLPHLLSVLLLRFRDRTPHRWRVPLPLPAPDSAPTRTLHSLEARPVDGTLNAPISGCECLAYQVCVLFDTSGDARPPEWALQEQRGVDLRLGDDLELSPDELFLESPVELVEEIAEGISRDALEQSDDERYARIKRFLRQRGLFAADGQFHFYEARLAPGDTVEVADFDDVSVVRHTDAIEGGDLPALPRPD